jgi:hypothetical protein
VQKGNQVMPDNDFEKLQKSMAMRVYRLQIGKDPDVVAWQGTLEHLLIRMSDKLSPGRLESFPGLSGGEGKMLSALTKKVMVPDHVCAVYVPPSVLESMIEAPPSNNGDGAEAAGEDVGICLGTRSGDFETIV